MWPFGWGMMIVMFFGWLLPLVAVVLIINYVINGRSRKHARETDDAAIRAARERYARGEISREEFQQLLADLRQAGTR